MTQSFYEEPNSSECICDIQFLFCTYVFRKHLWHCCSCSSPMFPESICDPLYLYVLVLLKCLKCICDPSGVVLCQGVQKASVTPYTHPCLVEMLSHLKMVPWFFSYWPCHTVTHASVVPIFTQRSANNLTSNLTIFVKQNIFNIELI